MFASRRDEVSEQIKPERRIAGGSGAKSRLRCGVRAWLTRAVIRAAPISNARLKRDGARRARFRPHSP
jgi:hypothetical protein